MYKGEDKVLDIISKKKTIMLKELAGLAGMNEDSIRRIIESLKSSGYVETKTKEGVTFEASEEFEKYAGSAFPEISVYHKAKSGVLISDLGADERSIGLRWAKTKGLVAIEGGKLVAAKSENEAKNIADALKGAYQNIKKREPVDPVLLDELCKRHLVTKHSSKTIYVTPTGKTAEKEPAGFDVTVAAADAPVGKNHPITKLSKRIRSIMAELGFEEMDGSLVESSFWCFDALFQPQDHPARELADTFYLDGETPLPDDKALVERVRQAHEKGWNYTWDPKEARKLVLRTHTTALSARYLSAIKDKKPRKYFAIGRVFRNEATDYKHLAEFHQVEGIIAWKDATFTDLLGILKEFYRKLGFEKIRFRPSFFPYTEPSLEVEVFFEPKQQWLELGGAGIFRPEVSIPLAGIYPVLAWGLSLERPLMLALDLDDIRTFYKNDIDFLKKTRLDI